MPHQTTFNPELQIIETKYSGNISIEELKSLTIEIAKLATENNCFLTLGDFREAFLQLSTVDIYELPQTLSDALKSSGLMIYKFKRALVVAKSAKDFLFFQTVAANQGQTTKVFYDVEEAKEWLTKK